MEKNLQKDASVTRKVNRVIEGPGALVLFGLACVALLAMNHFGHDLRVRLNSDLEICSYHQAVTDYPVYKAVENGSCYVPYRR